MIRRLPPTAIVLSVQTLGELFNVFVLKAKQPPSRARAAVLSWGDGYVLMETSTAVMINAANLASDHGLSVWDSVVLAAAAEAECRLLLIRGPRRGVYVAWSHRYQSVRADAAPDVGGLASGRQVTSRLFRLFPQINPSKMAANRYKPFQSKG